jgi:LacI family transcriptional regulator, repressor for deo operon, udp, cdd, tsx, nupC, and nupG
VSIVAVAQQAGVSVATVSRVFNFPERVRAPTRERVEHVAQRLGYRPNASAQTLRTQRSKVIGVVLPTLLNPVFAECLDGIAVSADAAGYSILPMTTDYLVQEEERAAMHLVGRGVDGMVLVVADPASSRALKRLRAAGVPYVLAYNRHPRHPCVSVDGEAAVAAVVRRLCQHGHRRIAMVGGEFAASDRSRQRYRGFVRGIAECGLPPGRMIEVPFIGGAVARLADVLRESERPTALVCSNDLLAIRALRAAHVAGLEVPRELSVVGFDGITLGCDITPVLSTVVQPNRDIGRQAVELLAGALEAAKPLGARASITSAHSFRDGESLAGAPDIP